MHVGAGTRDRAVLAPRRTRQIGAHCRIGPYARIRPGDVARRRGAHRQFRRSEGERDRARRSKANHLAYVGDTIVGANVNIGAGTITCNYDGANKHRTVIEDDVHIGSDTQLVAPVTIGRGATIGAGTHGVEGRAAGRRHW